MFSLKGVSKEEVKEFFKNDLNLCYLGLGDQYLAQLYYNDVYACDKDAHMDGVYVDNELAAIFKYDYFSKICLNIHFYLKSKYHNTGMLRKMAEFIYPIAKSRGITKMVTMVPHTCPHVLEAMEGLGWNKEGTITKCQEWRQKIVDLIIYGKEL